MICDAPYDVHNYAAVMDKDEWEEALAAHHMRAAGARHTAED